MQISTLIRNNTQFLLAHQHVENEIPNVCVSRVDFGEFDHPLNLLFIVYFREFPCFCITTTKFIFQPTLIQNTFIPNKRSHVGKNRLQCYIENIQWEHSVFEYSSSFEMAIIQTPNSFRNGFC